MVGGQTVPGGASALGGPLGGPSNALSFGATGNYLTGQPTTYSAAYENARGFGISGSTAGDVGLKAPLGNSTSIMGGANLNTGAFSAMATYKF